MSKADMTVPVFQPNTRFRMIAGMSIPPVDPPILITSPSPTPSSTPAHIAARSGSSTRCCSTSMCWNTPRKKGYANVPIAVEAANFLPSTSAPIMKNAMLITATETVMLMPMLSFSILAMPLTPLTTMLYGRAKHAIENAQIAFPAIICMSSNTAFFVTLSSIISSL